MNSYAALFLVLSFLAAQPQAQQYSVDQRMEEMRNGIPILDPKLSLLVNDIRLANFQAVDFHNEKFVKSANEIGGLSPAWISSHEFLVARWVGWNAVYPEWIIKKKVEASSSMVVAGGAVKVRSIETAEAQNIALLRWKSVLFQIARLNENKAALGGMSDLGEKWSGFVDRVYKLDRAINALRKY